jgi:hypothetical protein
MAPCTIVDGNGGTRIDRDVFDKGEVEVVVDEMALVRGQTPAAIRKTPKR